MILKATPANDTRLNFHRQLSPCVKLRKYRKRVCEQITYYSLVHFAGIKAVAVDSSVSVSAALHRGVPTAGYQRTVPHP